MIGHSDTDEIRTDSNVTIENDDPITKPTLSDYPIMYVVASSFIVGLIFGVIAGVGIGLILA